LVSRTASKSGSFKRSSPRRLRVVRLRFPR
jgi:hypothetical protein